MSPLEVWTSVNMPMVALHAAPQQLQYHRCPAAHGANSLRDQALLAITVPQQPSGSPALPLQPWELRKAHCLDPSGLRMAHHSSA